MTYLDRQTDRKPERQTDEQTDNSQTCMAQSTWLVILSKNKYNLLGLFRLLHAQSQYTPFSVSMIEGGIKQHLFNTNKLSINLHKKVPIFEREIRTNY